jgi:hypothetical protein
MTHTTALAPVLAEHIAAVNAFDEDAIVATFADDALGQRRAPGILGDRGHPPLGGQGTGRRPGDHRGD